MVNEEVYKDIDVYFAVELFLLSEELAWAMLPEGLEPYFEIENFKKTEAKFHNLAESRG